MPRRYFAFFDLDHTLLPHDTQALFCNFVLHREPWRVFLHLFFLPYALLRAVGLVSTLRAKRAFNSYLWRMPLTRLRSYAQQFAETSAVPWGYPELMAELERQREADRVLVLNTASPDFYARAIAQAFGFDYCVATKAALPTARFPLHPAIAENNKREAKIKAMIDEVPGVEGMSDDERTDHCWAYSDSAADLPLLRFGGNAVLIHPAPMLATLGLRNEWSFLYPQRPYGGKLGNLFAMLRQMLGLYPERPSS